MNVAEAVERRISVRSFKSDPVTKRQVLRLLDRAMRAPSGGNLQPWRVYGLQGALHLTSSRHAQLQIRLESLRNIRSTRVRCGTRIGAGAGNAVRISTPRWGFPGKIASADCSNWPGTGSYSARRSACSSVSTGDSARRNGPISACSSRR
ncbi:nitroreductase family protein [Bradyrhizobium cenepequi]